MFAVKLQAAGGKVVAAKGSYMRKDVTAKLYGGDVTRKRSCLRNEKGKTYAGKWQGGYSTRGVYCYFEEVSLVKMASCGPRSAVLDAVQSTAYSAPRSWLHISSISPNSCYIGGKFIVAFSMRKNTFSRSFGFSLDCYDRINDFVFIGPLSFL